MVKCSIIIPVYNEVALTRQCLNALLAHLPAAMDVEIIVVDDASTDSTGEQVRSYGERVRLLTHSRNTGFATACNDGAAAAHGEYVLFLNNDTIPQAGWLDALVRYAESHPRAAVVGSKLLFPNNTIQHAGVAIGQDHWPLHIYSGFPAEHPAVNYSRRFQIVTAACALFRKASFEQANGFDTAFVNGGEDVDLCLRLGQQGQEVHYCHESVLYHLESASAGRHQHDDVNGALYTSRWASRVQPDDVQYYLEDGLLQIHYPARNYAAYHPIQVSLSPLLGVLDENSHTRQSDQLLATRARQVFELLRENIRLDVSLLAARAQSPGEE